MGTFQDCCSNIMEPYGGNMPLFKSEDTTDATVTIVEEAYDDGMKITRIQTPPRQNTRSLICAIDNILGLLGDMDIGSMKKEDDKNDSKVSSRGKSQNKKDDNGDSDGLQEQPGFGQENESDGVAEKD